MTTLLTDSGTHAVAATATGDDLWLDAADVARVADWTLKPEGMCQGPVCVPLPRAQTGTYVDGGRVNIAAFWRLLDRPVLHDAAGATWILGMDAGTRARQLESLEAPDFCLPDLDGREHRLSDYRGKRVFLATWSSW